MSRIRGISPSMMLSNVMRPVQEGATPISPRHSYVATSAPLTAQINSPRGRLSVHQQSQSYAAPSTSSSSAPQNPAAGHASMPSTALEIRSAGDQLNQSMNSAAPLESSRSIGGCSSQFSPGGVHRMVPQQRHSANSTGSPPVQYKQQPPQRVPPAVLHCNVQQVPGGRKSSFGTSGQGPDGAGAPQSPRTAMTSALSMGGPKSSRTMRPSMHVTAGSATVTTSLSSGGYGHHASQHIVAPQSSAVPTAAFTRSTSVGGFDQVLQT